MEQYDIFSILIYFLVFVLLFLSVYTSYRMSLSEKDRKKYRTNALNFYKKNKEKIEKKAKNSELDRRLSQIGNPLGLTAFVYHAIRYVFLLVILFNYLVIPYINADTISRNAIYVLVGLFILTSPKAKFSLINVIIIGFEVFYRKKVISELFTFYDILKDELNSLNKNQDINVHNLLKNSLDYFDYIDKALMAFIRNYRFSPELARDKFIELVPGNHSRIIANILYKFDSSNKEELKELIEGAANVFTTVYLEEESRKEEKKIFKIDILLFAGTMFSLVWVLYFFVIMMSNVPKSIL